MAEMYKATVTHSSRKLTAKERIKLKDEKLHYKLNVVLDPSCTDGIYIEPKSWANVHVSNPHSSKSTEYDYLVVEDADGSTYMTGSESFREAFLSIWEEMQVALEENPEEEFKIHVYGQESKNYSSGFLTCSLA